MHHQSHHTPQIPQVLSTCWGSGRIQDHLLEIKAVNESKSLFLCPNTNREQSALDSLACFSAKPEDTERVQTTVDNASMLVSKTATAAQARGDLIQGDMR